MPSAPGLVQVRQVDEQPGIEVKPDANAVAGDRRDVAQRPVLLLPLGAQAHHLGIGRLDLRARPDLDLARDAVDDDGVAGIAERRRVLDLADGRDAERARHDRDVARRAALLQHDAAQPRRIVVEEGRRPHRAGHEDRVVGQERARTRALLPGEAAQQAVGEVVEIVQAIAQVRIALAHHPRAVVGLHALDRGLRGEARDHGLAHPAQPALVMGEHADGLQHLARFTGPDLVAALDQGVDGRAHRLDRRLQPCDLGLDILGDQGLHHDARLVQHHMAEADAVGEHDAARADGAACRGSGIGRQSLQLARGDHLREHHRGGLERLDLLVGIDAVGLVLDGEHAERVAGAQQRHAEEGVIGLLARLRTVGEGRVRLRVGERERLGRLRDQADEAFVGAHAREMHRLAVQAFGGEQFEGVVVAQHVDRADLGDDVGGDDHDDAVQARLGADRLRHSLAEAAQQQARASGRSGHRLVNPLSAGRLRLDAGDGTTSGASLPGGPARLRPDRGRIASGACGRQARYRRHRSGRRI